MHTSNTCENMSSARKHKCNGEIYSRSHGVCCKDNFFLMTTPGNEQALNDAGGNRSNWGLLETFDLGFELGKITVAFF